MMGTDGVFGISKMVRVDVLRASRMVWVYKSASVSLTTYIPFEDYYLFCNPIKNSHGQDYPYEDCRPH